LANASLALDKSTVVAEYKEEIEHLNKEKDKIAKKLAACREISTYQLLNKKIFVFK